MEGSEVITAADLRGAIPAMPLLLDESGAIDWRAQRAVVRYYLAAGVDGVAVGVHTTQFELHDDPGALAEVWRVVAEEAARRDTKPLLIAGICGDTEQAVREATTASELGYQAGLLCGRGMAEVAPAPLLQRARAVGEVMPTIGFYLQESVGGRYLPQDFWAELASLESVIGVKAAPFDRYRTREVAQAILTCDRWDEVALLTGNDDAIVADLVTPHRYVVDGQTRQLRVRGGLLGQYAVGTKAAVELTHRALGVDDQVPADLLALGQDLTEVNAAVFDVRHDFAGCVPGVNEVLRQQGLAATARCFSPTEQLSAGQSELIAQARTRHPDLLDEQFIAEHREEWLAD